MKMTYKFSREMFAKLAELENILHPAIPLWVLDIAKVLKKCEARNESVAVIG